jgi:hypothetical protein
MRRRIHSDANNLDWTVRRLWLPEAVRPIGVRQVHSGATRGNDYAGVGVVVSPIFSLIFALPTMLVLVPLRLMGKASWEIEATARPWGRMGPTHVRRWRVRGWSQSRQAVEEIAAALGRGEADVRLPGVTRDA